MVESKPLEKGPACALGDMHLARSTGGRELALPNVASVVALGDDRVRTRPSRVAPGPRSPPGTGRRTCHRLSPYLTRRPGRIHAPRVSENSIKSIKHSAQARTDNRDPF